MSGFNDRNSPRRIAAICDGGMFPRFIFDDLIFVKRFKSLALWRFDNCKMIDPSCADCCQCLGFIDSVFDHPEVVCTGCNVYPCVCHYKLARSEYERNGKRQIG